MTRPSLAALTCALLLGGCLGRAADLIADSNAQVIITGAPANAELTVEVADEQKRLIAPDTAPVVVYLTVAPGAHEGIVRAGGDAPRCARFSLIVEEEVSPAVASVDLRAAPLCAGVHDAGQGDAGDDDAGSDDAGSDDAGSDDAGSDDAGSDAGGDAGGDDAGLDDAGPDDAGCDEASCDDAGDEPDDAGEDGGQDGGEEGGVDAGPPLRAFVYLSESLALLPCLEPLLCLERTRVDANGGVTFLDVAGLSVSGQVTPADVEALAAATLSAEADALFAGEDPLCPQPRPLALLPVTLERRHQSADSPTPIVESVSVADCGGVASELRARLSFLRQLALGL